MIPPQTAWCGKSQGKVDTEGFSTRSGNSQGLLPSAESAAESQNLSELWFCSLYKMGSVLTYKVAKCNSSLGKDISALANLSSLSLVVESCSEGQSNFARKLRKPEHNISFQATEILTSSPIGNGTGKNLKFHVAPRLTPSA